MAKNNFGFVKAEYERQTQLKEAGAGTGKSFQLAEANYHGEMSRIAAYESQLKQLGVSATNVVNGKMVKSFPVLSPINGTIGRININTGAFVQPGASIMEVVDHSKIHCDLMVFEKDLGKVRLGQRVNLKLTNQDNRQISGKISGINKSFENESKVVVVHAVIDPTKDKNLIPGMYVTALIHTGEKLVSALPLDAVVYSGGKPYVFVVEPDKKDGLYRFKKTEVKTGVTENGYIEIILLKSLASGTQIVNKGAFYLESKAAGAQEH
ncbi:efflux transporter, RND family, MFP subunit [compost metagenome]